MSDFAEDTNVPISDCISRQAAINVADYTDYTGLAIEDVKKVTDEVVKGLRQLPSAQPEHKTGKWIYKNDLKQFFCSECGYPSLTYDDTYIYGMDLPNYCEDCGADMREGQDG